MLAGPGVPVTSGRVAALIASLAFAAILVLNTLQVTQSERLALQVGSPALGGLLVLGAGAITLAFAGLPGLALGCLVVLVGANLSEVLVREHGMPSLLQVLAIPMSMTAALVGAREGWRGLRHPLVAASLAWGLMVAASTTWADSVTFADEELVETARGLAIFLLVVLLTTTRRRLRLAITALVAVTATLGALGLIQGLSGLDWGEFGGLARIKDAQIYGDVFEERIAGPWGDPNFFAQNLLLVLPLAGALAWDADSPRRRVAFLVASLLILGGLFFTYSRGAALALAVQTVLLLPLLGRAHRRAVLGLGMVGILLLLLLPTGFGARMATIAELVPGSEGVVDPDSSFEERRVVTGTAWLMFLDHPVAGVGAGNYTVHFDAYAAEMHSAGREYFDGDGDGDRRQYPHNLYLEVAAETGLLGLSVFLGLLAVALDALGGVLRMSRDGASRSYARGLVLGLAGYLVAALFLHAEFQRPLWLMLGFAVALATLACVEPGHER